MTTINDATSSPPLQPANSAQAKANAAAADVANTSTNTASTGTTAGAAATTGAASANTSSSVTNLSTISTQLQAAQATSSSDAVFSTSKVNEIKQAISEGRFQVNSANVASKLLDSVHELLGSRQRS